MLRTHIAPFWGVLGVVTILVRAIVKLIPVAAEPFQGDTLTTVGWVTYALSIILMGWSEGYRGFQKAFSPRVVARAFALRQVRNPLYLVLAPLFCMGLMHATRKRLIVSWCILVGVVLLVIGVRMLAQPWRGAIDAGVVVGLGWGVVAILVFYVRAVLGRLPAISPDLPPASPA